MNYMPYFVNIVSMYLTIEEINMSQDMTKGTFW